MSDHKDDETDVVELPRKLREDVAEEVMGQQVPDDAVVTEMTLTFEAGVEHAVVEDINMVKKKYMTPIENLQ
jgi:hypothetical protein